MARRSDDPRQMALDGFAELPRQAAPTPGSLDFDAELRMALNRALKEAEGDRFQISAEMSRLTGGEVTKFQIDSWTGMSRKAWRFPLEMLPAFVSATGAYWLLDQIAGKCGCKVLAGEDVFYAEMAKVDRALDQLKAKKTELQKSVGTRR